ncbi:MAG: site-specific DNA-methyltransferase [Proteobacteria bacterium]|nr:site-specific DNA-methyltransferase [Pseudomonadota bacterium]
MARKKTTESKRPIESYEHKGKKRVNNPPVGLVTPDTDPDAGAKKSYAYDPHLDPQLQWAGKAEHTSFEVPTVSLHVHERIDPRTIIEAVRKRNGGGMVQGSLFEMLGENPPLREAIEFYKHAHGWSNRLVAGDSLLVMNSLLEKEGMAGKVQMIFNDPPYGIKYGSNFQPFVNKRDVKDGKDEDLTTEPEQIRAFRDTWELGIHSYLTYLRDRLLLERELLNESGSVFVQISDENVHHVRELMDEVFGAGNFVVSIAFQKKAYQDSNLVAPVNDFVLWYGKDKKKTKCNHLFVLNEFSGDIGKYNRILSPMGLVESSNELEPTEIEDRLKKGWRLFREDYPLISQDPASGPQPFEFGGKVYLPTQNRHWSIKYPDGLEQLERKGRIRATNDRLYGIMFWDDNPLIPLSNFWAKMKGAANPIYVVQTTELAIQRCLLMTTDPGDLVFDPTCGSGTTAYVAEQWGRRWITCDTSRVALTLAKQRLMTAVFDYYELAHPQEGVGSGFIYKTVPHVTLKSIANNEPPGTETLYDQPLVDRKKHRVSGPFTIEAVPAPAVKSIEETLTPTLSQGEREFGADTSIARSGETLRQGEWRDELLRTGIRGKAGQHIRFARLEPLPGCRHLHADGETRPSDEGKDSVRESGTAYAPQRIVVSFGPEHAPLEQRQVAQAIEEAQTLVPKPKLIVFAAFQFDPEAAKDIDETNWPGVTLLKAQMNADLLTDDLKKKRASNESFWLIGQPDVRLERIAPSPQPSPTGRGSKGEGVQWRVSVEGFDYYNTKTGGIESGGAGQIAVWLLDTDYDGRSLYPRQVFFPQAGESEGWARLAKNLKAEIDEELIEAYRGTVSLPFAAGEHKRIAVKIVDDRGIESLKVLGVE